MIPPPSIQLELWLGAMVPTPAPAAVTALLRHARITRNADGPSSFELEFHNDRTLGFAQDLALLGGGQLKPWQRVLVGVRMNGSLTVLIDGFITGQQLAHDRAFGGSVLTITGEDVGILMDRIEYSLEYPGLPDSVIALAVLAKYAVIGIAPEVIPSPIDLVPLVIERSPQQNATDRCYLQQLGQRYGFRFSVRPGPEPLTNIARWGPPLNFGSACPPLSVDVGAATNVEKVSFKLDSLAPVLVYGMVQDDLSEFDLPLATLTSTRLPPLATDPALDPVGMFQRRDLFTDPRYGYLQALSDAQARTDSSTDKVLTVEGELDTVRYGAVLDVPGLVDLRGAGQSYDGRYRVEGVTHTLARGSYRQQFRLAREGTGSTISQVAA